VPGSASSPSRQDGPACSQPCCCRPGVLLQCGTQLARRRSAAPAGRESHGV
jgi:hypothetical protein